MNNATHRLFQLAPPSLWSNILEGATLPQPCLNDAGNDLLFSALTHPQILAQANIEAANHASKSAVAKEAEQALTALAQRQDTDPLALRAIQIGKGKKAPVIHVSNLELAIRLSLQDVTQALLQHPSLTPEARRQHLANPSLWHPQGLLALAIERDLTLVVKPLAQAGWDLQAKDTRGLCLVALARSAAMINALIEAGLDPKSLEAPGLIDVVSKRVKRAELPTILEAIVARSGKTLVNAGEQAWHWLRSDKDEDPNQYSDLVPKDRLVATKKLLARQEEWRQRVADSEPLEQWRVLFKSGTLKGELTLPAMLARLVQENSNNVAFSFLQGMEEQVFSGPATDIAPGVPDYGVWALWVSTAQEFRDRWVEEKRTPLYAKWVEDTIGTLQKIEDLHSPEQWLAWKTQAAATLSRRPTLWLMDVLHQWSEELIEPLNVAENPSEAKAALEVLESLQEAGVAFQGRGLNKALQDCLANFYPAEQGLNETQWAALQGLRDRVMLASLGVEERFKNHAISSGLAFTEPMKNDVRDANKKEMFLPSNAEHWLSNPALVDLVKKGLSRATDLNFPNAEATRAVLRSRVLDDRLPTEKVPAVTQKPRF